MKTPQIILALDIGLKRIGIAKAIQNIALPISPILRKSRNQAAKEVSQLIIESKADLLLVGIPITDSSLNLDSNTHIPLADNPNIAQAADNPILEMQRRIRHFVNLLEIPKDLPILFLDESFSSFEALQQLEDKKMRKRAHSRDGTLDSLAALVILERYLGMDYAKIPPKKESHNDKQP
ncbi:RuvX/YqgF family protein [Helicobacter sp. MIT 05-5294]|uniref:RuvX/YqgF family protein n=1 Tax=Helicobacter sp. MIT 05-5294 TaxID=1548150 RepID=UPI000AED1CC4|nr:RuvX/YqgF family protein [Helicobacter sp. MIT 05-5294]